MFDKVKADRVIQFCETYGQHFEGPAAGTNVKLLPWQIDNIINPIFGTVDNDGLRQYRHALIFLPRKNAKSFLTAMLALYLLLGDGEEGAQVYICARDREQASVVYRYAARMVRSNPELNKICRVIDSQKRIIYGTRRLKVMSSDASSAYGLNASAVICDELAFWDTRDLYDAMVSSMKYRRQPLVISITTASNNLTGIGRQQYEYARGIVDGTITDDRYYAYICEAPADCDISDQQYWFAANPALATDEDCDQGKGFLRLSTFQDEYKTALNDPGAMLRFRLLSLNQWVLASETPYIPLDRWDACNEPLPDLTGKRCFGGLDLSQKHDLTCFSLVFPLDNEKYAILPHFFMPAENLAEKERLDRVPYSEWAKQGYLTLCPGPVVRHKYVISHILEVATKYELVEIAVDRAMAAEVIEELQEGGIETWDFNQSIMAFTNPTKALKEHAYLGNIIHGANPVLRWNIGCSTVKEDANNNIRVIKSNKRQNNQRIDGVIASIMAFDRAQRNTSDQKARAINNLIDDWLSDPVSIRL
jgi:phage terminase large subunit-like protein